MTAVVLTASDRAEWLARTADAMEEAGQLCFSMALWWYSPSTGALGLDQLRDAPEHECGTVACLAGWLTVTASDEARAAVAAGPWDPTYGRLEPDQRLARILDLDDRLWWTEGWPGLIHDVPEVYGVLNPERPWHSAIAFLRSQAAQ